MKFTLGWLKDHLDTKATLEEIAATLTRAGLEVERIGDPAAKLKGFVVAKVLDAKPHPNADRLRVCVVDYGAVAPATVVCGAPNARAGMKGVFSPVGTFIPGKGITLAKGTIRGIESEGMLCSGAELEISSDHDGILDLPADAPVGAPYAAYAGLDDPLIEINLTPNRPDAAGVAGIARDLAAAGLGTLKSADAKPVAGAMPCPTGVKLDFVAADSKLCPAFALRLVRGLRNGPSPEWMRRRLVAIGLRPINALVDVTNYMTFDRGRPLHVFDAAKVKGALVVRRAADGETLLGLDGKERVLDPSIVVIADDSGVESIAGVMGGERTGCDEGTTDALIESALWDPLAIAQAGRKLGIVTDARYRFERGVDPAFCLPGIELATRLIQSICGGEASRVELAGHPDGTRIAFPFPFAETKRLTGIDVPADEARDILRRLGFGVGEGAEIALVSVPTWRPDVTAKADVVEEIVRIAGLDRVTSRPLPRSAPGPVASPLTLLQKRVRAARRALAAQGLDEAVTWSFVARDRALAFGGGAPELALANPIAAELSDMRPSLAPGLIAAAGRNAARGSRDAALFEIGQVFRTADEDGQRIAAAAVRRGTAKRFGAGRHWDGAAGPVDAFDAKGDALALLTALGAPVAGLQIVAGGPEFLHPGRSAKLQFGPNVVGWFGEFHPATLEAVDVKGPLVGFEILLDALAPPKAKATKAKGKFEKSELMPVERDFAFVVPRQTKAADLLKAVRAADRTLIDDVGLFDVYAGAGVPDGMTSIGICVTLQPRDRTLTDAEIEAVAAKIVAEAGKRVGATLR